MAERDPWSRSAEMKVDLKIVKSTLFKGVLTDVLAMLSFSGYKNSLIYSFSIAETSVKTLLNCVDFAIFKLTLSSYFGQGINFFFHKMEVGHIPSVANFEMD